MLQGVFPVSLAGAAFMLGCFTHLTDAEAPPGADLARPPSAAIADEPVIAEPEAGAAGTGARSVTRAPDGLFYVRARVNGRSVRFMIDSGASDVMLTPADARAIGVAPRAGRIDGMVDTAGGSTAMAWAHLREVRVAGQRILNVRAAVVRRGLGVSLMGQNLLGRLGPLTIEGDTLAIGKPIPKGDLIA